MASQIKAAYRRYQFR